MFTLDILSTDAQGSYVRTRQFLTPHAAESAASDDYGVSLDTLAVTEHGPITATADTEADGGSLVTLYYAE